jgi:carboxymethylenebutenolidase
VTLSIYKIIWEDIMGNMINYTRPDGQTSKAYLAEPAQGSNAPGIVVIQEWWGLNDQIRSVAEDYAAQGYRALVPDLYRGEMALEANEAEHLMNGLDFADAASQDIRGAVQHLKSSGSSKVGVTGYCMGGALTILAAVFVPESDGNAVWYGYPPLEFVDADKIKAPLLGHWGIQDQFFAIDGVDALQAELDKAGVEYQFHRYDAKHAFANAEADSKNLPVLGYNPEAAKLAWDRTLAFFQKYLS